MPCLAHVAPTQNLTHSVCLFSLCPLAALFAVCTHVFSHTPKQHARRLTPKKTNTELAVWPRLVCAVYQHGTGQLVRAQVRWVCLTSFDVSHVHEFRWLDLGALGWVDFLLRCCGEGMVRGLGVLLEVPAFAALGFSVERWLQQA